METVMSVPDADGIHINVFDQEGVLLRRELTAKARAEGYTDSDLKVVPDWVKQPYEAFKKYFEVLLEGGEIGFLNALIPGEEAIHSVGILKMLAKGPGDGIWFSIQPQTGLAYMVPLAFVTSMGLQFKKPGAFYYMRPAIYLRDAATIWGAYQAEKKGYRLSAEFIGKIIPPICPICLQEMVASYIMNTEKVKVGEPTPSEALRHLWLCRLCSPDTEIPVRIVSQNAGVLREAEIGRQKKLGE